jgi:DnaK suppressor protein
VDTARARALLDQERRRLEQLGRAVARDHDDAVATSSPEDPVDGAGRRVAEETSQALGERLRDRWGALERAEARLAAGTYGASVLSGRPIPDERLEAFPLAELTVDEAARDRSLGGRHEPARPATPSGCSRTRQPKTMGWSRTTGAMTSRAHRPTSASERPPRPNAATAWGRWTDSTPRTAAPVDAPDRAPAASTAQTARRRGLVTRGSLETSRNDTTCGLRSPRPRLGRQSSPPC